MLYDLSISLITLLRLLAASKTVSSRPGGIRHLVLSMLLVVGAIASIMIDSLMLETLTSFWPMMGTFAWIALPSVMLYEYRLDARSTKIRTSENEKSN